MRSRIFGTLMLLAGVAAAVWAWNEITVARPVRTALSEDTRNSSYTLRAHYAYYVQPSTLTLDLTRVDSASPADLWRGLFQSAKSLSRDNRSFDRIVLARSGPPGVPDERRRLPPSGPGVRLWTEPDLPPQNATRKAS
jgi:hypothetical protein